MPSLRAIFKRASFSFKDHRQLSLPCAADGLAVLGEPAEKISKFLKKIADFFSFLTNVGLLPIILATTSECKNKR